MKKMEYIQSEWKIFFDSISKKRGFYRLEDDTLGRAHYVEALKQIFHHARENPAIQALATVYFRGEQRTMTKNFYRHAITEIGHDQLALDDLKALGEDITAIPFQRPLPATTALLAYAYFQIQHRNPLGYLGYLFHLEFMPTRNGKGYLDNLQRLGIPKEAMSFLIEHMVADTTHNKWMKEYVETLVKTPQDLDVIIYSAKVTAQLYSNMIHEAFEHADQQHPVNWGIEPTEFIKAENDSSLKHSNFIPNNLFAEKSSLNSH